MNTAFAASGADPLAGVADPKDVKYSVTDDEKQATMSIIESMHNHRRLTSRQIQLLSIAGTVGEGAFRLCCNARAAVPRAGSGPYLIDCLSPPSRSCRCRSLCRNRYRSA